MEYTYCTYKIHVEFVDPTTTLFQLTIDDQRNFKIYKGTFDMHIVADTREEFELLMKKFFDGKYFFHLDGSDALALKLSFKVVMESIVMKRFEFSVPLLKQLSQSEEVTQRLQRLEDENAAMRKQLERLNIFVERYVGNPQAMVTICTVTIQGQRPYPTKTYIVEASNTSSFVAIDWNQSFVASDTKLPELSVNFNEETPGVHQTLSSLPFLEELEFLNYSGIKLSSFFSSHSASNTLKRLKLTNCPKLTTIQIPTSWWNLKTVTFEKCPDLDFEYLFDGKPQPIENIILIDCPERLCERYQRRLAEINIRLQLMH
jgi:hypothetical protein